MNLIEKLLSFGIALLLLYIAWRLLGFEWAVLLGLAALVAQTGVFEFRIGRRVR